MRSKLKWRLTDLAVTAAVCGLIGTGVLDTVRHARDVNNRAKCASNLHQLGLAILLYQNDNNQAYPRTIMDDTADHKPLWGTPYSTEKNAGPLPEANPFDGNNETPAANDVTAAFYLLLRDEHITSKVFICPSTRLKEFDFGGGAHTALDWTNWPGDKGIADHLSYGYQDPYPSNAALAAGYNVHNPDATFVVAGDMGPGGDASLAVTPKSAEKEMHEANSFNHQGEGQNFLYGDGHAEWRTSPFAGTRGDDVYTAGGGARGKSMTGVSSTSGSDSILMPTAADVHFVPPPPPTPLGTEALAKLEKDVQGTYTASEHKSKFVLIIDRNTVKITSGPVTVLYNYVVSGGQDTTLNLKLTAPDTAEEGLLTLDGNTIKFETKDDFNFDADWHRTDPKP